MQYELKNTICDICKSSKSKELMRFDDASYHLCCDCGLVYSQPMVENYKQLNEKVYSKKITSYSAKFSSRQNKLLSKIRQLKKYRQNGNLLEIGSNTGSLLRHARNMGWIVKGVDISDSACNYAKENYGLDVFAGEIQEAAFDENYFDVIIMCSTLEHLRNPLETLKECHRILRKGGVIYADTVNWDSFTYKICKSKWKMLNPIEHPHLYSPISIKHLCQNSGLKLIKLWTSGVRTRTNDDMKALFRWMDLLKIPLTLLSRLTYKGDNIKFLAIKE